MPADSDSSPSSPARGLEALFAPPEAHELLESKWPHTLHVVHGGAPPARFLEFPHFASLDALFNQWAGEVAVILPGKYDEHSFVMVRREAARQFYEQGMSVTFPRVENQIAVLKDLLEGIRGDLALPSRTLARCTVYASPNDKGNAAHFDQNSNFVVQLHGEKTWRLAANAHVRDPTERYAVSMEEVPDGLAHYVRSLPRAMPADVQEVCMRPGSVLFVPRGTWHETKACGDSLSLNFTFSSPTWCDLFMGFVRRRLEQHPHWRELATGLTASDSRRREGAESRFDEVLSSWQSDVGPARAQSVLTEGWPSRRLGFAGPARLIEIDSGMMARNSEGEEFELEIEREYLPALRWIEGHPEGFLPDEIGSAFPTLPVWSLTALLQQLLTARVLQIR